MNENSLNNKLNRIDETLNIMKTNLHLSEDEVIENLAEATNLHGLVNIFVQEEEPEKKEGIWFQTDQSFKDIIMKDSPIVPNEIRTAESQLLSQSTAQSTLGSIAVGNTLYCVKSTTELTIICYNLLTHATTEINTGKVFNYTITCPLIVHKDGYLYMLITPAYQYHAVKFNLSTHECEIFPIVNPQTSCYSAYDNKIYYGSTSSGYDVYSFSLDTCTQELAVSYLADALKVLYPVGQYLIGFSGVKGRSQVRDITNGYNSVSHKIGNFDVDSYGGIAYFLEAGKYVYLIYSGKNGVVHRLNKDTLSVEENVLSLGDSVYILGGFEHNGQLYLIYSQDRNYGKVPYYYAPLSLESEDYENNSVIISQAPCTKTEKRTQLWDIVFNNRLLYTFYDAYYYDKENGFILDIPTYYGDGEQWVKFKN